MIYLSSQLRWLVVWKRVLCLYSWDHIQRHMSGGPGQPRPGLTQLKSIVRRYRRFNDVKTFQGVRRSKPTNTIFDFRRDRRLMNILLDAPGDMLCEIRSKFARSTGVKPDLSTICKAIHRLGFSRKRVRTYLHPALPADYYSPFTCPQLRAYSRRRNAAASLAFKNKLRRYSSDQLYFLDETSKDGRALRRSMGYALRGEEAIARNGH